MHHCILPPTTEHCRQLIHYHWVPFLFPSPSLCHTHWVPSCCPPPTTLTHWSVSVWKPYYVLLLDLQTQLDRELQSRPEPVLCLNYVFVWVWIQLHTSLFACADTCMYMISSEWIMKGLHQSNSAQVVRFSPFKAPGNCGGSAIWPSWWLEAYGQAHTSQGFTWHIIQLCCWPLPNTLTWLFFNENIL